MTAVAVTIRVVEPDHEDVDSMTKYAVVNMPLSICRCQYAVVNMPLSICRCQYAVVNMPLSGSRTRAGLERLITDRRQGGR